MGKVSDVLAAGHRVVQTITTVTHHITYLPTKETVDAAWARV